MDQILFRTKPRLFGIVERTSGGAEVLGDIGADEGELDRIKDFVKNRDNGSRS